MGRKFFSTPAGYKPPKGSESKDVEIGSRAIGLTNLVDETKEDAVDVKEPSSATGKGNVETIDLRKTSPSEPAKKRRKITDSDEEITEVKSTTAKDTAEPSRHQRASSAPPAEEQESDSVSEAETDLKSVEKLYLNPHSPNQ
jgi:hypothetical protein